MMSYRTKRKRLVTYLSCLGLLILISGCFKQSVNQQSPDDYGLLDSKVHLVGDYTSPFGIHSLKVEGVALVTGLQGTGSSPSPSVLKSAILGEMRVRNVKNPERWLSSSNTAMVQVVGFLPPGVKKGNHFDLYVKCPSRSETTSLRGGMMLETRLSEMAMLGARLRTGKLQALSEGPVLVDPFASAENHPEMLKQGKILGGGIAKKTRDFGLVMRDDHRSAHTASRIANAINSRFHTIGQVLRSGVAKAKTDKYIELQLYPRYEQNVARYIKVIRSISVSESDEDRANRLRLLESQLLDPITSASAALKLEAIGKQSINILKKGIIAQSAEVRFYAAEALAYLDEAEAVEVLAVSAKNEPAFRAYALTALSAMNDTNAFGVLADLLQSNSAETRYGAFRALWSMNNKDGLVRGEMIGGVMNKENRIGGFRYHVIDTTASPMIHLTTNTRAEIVLFGKNMKLRTPLSLDAGKDISINGNPDGSITVSRIAFRKKDEKKVVSNRVDEVLRAIAELGGTYPAIVQALKEAKETGALEGKLAVNVLPSYYRSYQRNSNKDASTTSEDEKTFKVASPAANMFDQRAEAEPNRQSDDNE